MSRKFNDYQVIRVEPIIYRYGKAAISPFNSKSKVSLTRDKDIVYLKRMLSAYVLRSMVNYILPLNIVIY